MKHLIIIWAHRLLTLMVALGLLTPGSDAWQAQQPSTTNQGVGATIINAPMNASHDNNVWWEQLGHDSRDTLYRTPGGPVTTGTYVTLRLRAASGDLTSARVRIFNDRLNTLQILDMSLIADDGTYEWWQIAIQAATLPTVFWYRFIAIDGTDVDYYADDDARLGGWGNPSDEEVDNSWQLTIYNPAFHTPDWVKNAIIYQIFPDRFRDGDIENDIPAGSIYYGENNTIYRSNTTNWNQLICDPRVPTGACAGVYGQNFYGGDLQGVIDKLDYLEQLGVTAIYFNPIFRSPSNHGYDTTNYQAIDDSYGDVTLFEDLASQAAAHGIAIILDGVFNHTSTDSVYFDLYKRYLSGEGACESIASFYRKWYFFYDVEPGTGPCVSSTGAANGADYLSWNGIDNLPLLNSAEDRVREQFWAPGTMPIGPIWVGDGRAEGWRLDTASEIDPGTIIDANNDYWEGFRTEILKANSQAYIIGEEWGNVSSWTLGTEWDAGTNYQLSTALLGFWRDEPFVDNDHNANSAAGVIEPLLPSELNERLLNLQERYSPEALAAMMNLLDSHDTNRALFMLDHNTDLNNSTTYRTPSYSWSDAITRLRGAVLMQMTLPGAPTIYYGDEVGLVSPVTFDLATNTWQDDPYNRQTYPWLDQSGTPYYTHLQSQASQDLLRNYYTLLTSTRSAHPALRTGTFDPLKVDDINMVYAYGRRLLDPADAAIVVLNRATSSQSVTLDLSGYLPATSALWDALNNNAQYNIASDGSLTLPAVPAMSGMLLVLASGDILPPAAPAYLIAEEGENLVSLTWGASADASSYQIFRSIVSGGGYAPIGTTSQTNYSDTTAINGIRYFYVVQSAKTLGVVSEYTYEVSAMPHWQIDSANLQSPTEVTHTIGLSPTPNYFGQVYIAGATSLSGATPGLIAQVGYGSGSVSPAEWLSWVEASFVNDQGSNDQFSSSITPESIGDFQVVFRYSTNQGQEWIYADLSGTFIGVPSNPSILHVSPAEDTSPPSTPASLLLADWGDKFVTMVWNPIPVDPTLYAYDIYRSTDISSTGIAIARVTGSTTEYTDTQVSSGTKYYYRVQAVDTSFNRSALSNQINATPLARSISVTIYVDVPISTPGGVFIVGDHLKIGAWDPGKVAMTRYDVDTWMITLDFQEGVYLEYKFTRGNYAWLDVETAADGNTDIPNRTLLVEGDRSGIMVVNTTVANWHDPFISISYPANRDVDIPLNPIISVTWNQSMTADTTFTMTGPNGSIPGTYSYDPSTYTVSFTPSVALQLDTLYTLGARYQTDAVGDPQLTISTWSFTTIETLQIYRNILPFILKK